MSLEQIINNDIKATMLAKDTKKLEALRAIKAALLLIKTGKDMSSGEIPESVEVSTLQKLIKQRKEAAEMYKNNGRQELHDEEIYQVGIIEQYLPAQLSDEEINSVVKKIIEQTGAKDVKDLGKVMGAASKELAGKADNKKVSEIVKQLLG